MIADTAVATTGREPEGPGRDALDTLYRFVAALELTPTVAIHAVDRDGVVRYWNQTCTQVFGVSAAEALGHPLTSLVSHLERENEFQSVLDGVWRSGKPAPARDWRVRRRDGAERWMYSTHFPVARSGMPPQLFCMEVDISERKVDEAALVEAGANFRQLFQRSHDAIVLIEGNTIIDANPAALAMFERPDKQAIIGKTLLDFSPVTQASGEASILADATIAAETFIEGNRRYEWQFRLPDGRVFWAEVLLTSVALDHQLLSYAVLRDISERKATEHTLTTAAQVFDNSRDAILIIDRQYRVLAANRAFTGISGIASEAVLGREAPGLRSGRHEAAYYQQIWQHVAAHDHWEGELSCVRHDGEEYPVWAALTAIRNSEGEVANYMAILSDMTERKRVEERNRYLAEHDILTGLPNRVLFLDRLQQALAAARRRHISMAVMFLDLDRFKGINDGFGHHVGDAVLREVARRLTGCVRGVDTVSRQGGDEFVVLLADIGGVDQAAHVAASVMHAVAQPVQFDGHRVSLSVSIGIALGPADGADVDTLLKHADVAMYHAKQSGRNAFSFFSAEMNAHVVERVQIENELRHALSNEEFVLEYQPEIDIASGAVFGLEALLRWRHPVRGLLAPQQFIPVAEECGLMVPIGEWVLRQACAEARRWRDQDCPVVVAVNLSAAQFMHGNLLGSVDDALARAGLAPEFLDLEITEQVLLQGDASALATVEALHARGVRLTIDDFGTGYSSLSFLRRFPLSKLKIDSSFVGEIDGEAAHADLIPAIIALARGLHLRVLAEGVETAAQLRFLQEHGCDAYQGRYAASAAGSAPGESAEPPASSPIPPPR